MNASSRLATALVLAAASGCYQIDTTPFEEAHDAGPGYRIGGTVAGMWDGAGMTIELTATDLAEPVSTTVDANGSFALDADLRSGTDYTITLAAPPTGHDCEIDGAEGTVAGADIDNVAITCDGPEVDVAFSAPVPLEFDPAVLSYDVDVSVVVQQTRIAVTAPAATNIRIGEVTGYDSGDWTASSSLALGENSYEIEVEVDTASRIFNLAVNRGGGTIEEYLFGKASNAGIDDWLGSSLGFPSANAMGMDRDLLVVGAPFEDSGSGSPTDNGAESAGAAYVFRRSGSTWVEEAYLKASAIDAQDYFGYAVAASGNTIAIGAPNEDSAATGINGDDENDGASNRGAVYLFQYADGTWTQTSYVKPTSGAGVTNFGAAVALDGTTLAVGCAFGFTASAEGVYVFERGTEWAQQAVVTPNNGGDADDFGFSLDLDGNSLVIGSKREASCATGVNGSQTDDSCNGSGAAYVFARSGSTWSQQAYLKASNSGDEDEFGWSVAIDGDTVVVGAHEEDSASATNPGDNSAPNRGAAYVFQRSGTTWGQVALLKSSDVTPWFGTSVDVLGELIAVGATLANTGAATIFRRTPTWTEVAVVRPEDAQTGDSFGAVVRLSHETLAVVAPSEDTQAVGINPDHDASASIENDLGAIYSFR